MNTAVKHLTERGLVASGLRRLALRGHRGRTLVLAYHDVLPNGATTVGDASLHLAQRDFARQLDAIAESHEVLPLPALFARVRDSDRPRVVITFDDAYAGALTWGVDELVKRGMPATIFVAPALLASIPWWDRLTDSDQGAVPEKLRNRALDALNGRTDLILSSVEPVSADSARLSSLPRIGTDSELAAAASKPGITLGSHTWSHPNLCGLEKSELAVELRRPLEWLRSRFSSVVPWLSYPYGMQNLRVQEAAAGAGYTGAFRIEGGWLPTNSALSSYSLPRLNIPSGLSLDGFLLRIAGL